MRTTLRLLKTSKSILARDWKPRAAEAEPTIDMGTRHPERFITQIVLSDGSSFKVRSTAPRQQVKISKDTRTHPLWNPQADRQLDDEGGYLSSFQKKFQNFNSQMDFSFADDDQVAREQQNPHSKKKK